MNIVNAAPEQEARLVEILCQSFHNDPVVHWMISDDGPGRPQRLAEMFRMFLRMRSHSAGEVLTTTGLEGTFVWAPSTKTRVPLWKQLGQTRLFLRFCGLRAAPRVLSFFSTLEEQQPEEEHIYLQFMAVDPKCRGKGTARDLLRPVLDLADRKGIPCYGETALEQNVTIWKRYGLHAIGEIRFGSAPRLWKLRREPQSSPNRAPDGSWTLNI